MLQRSTYDPLLLGWMLRCPETQVLHCVPLTAFRQISRLDGPQHPAVFMVVYTCPECGSPHRSLVSQGELDVAPMMASPAPHFDLLIGRMRCATDLTQEGWVQALRRRRWPLAVECPTRRQVIPGWPSVLRAIEPDGARRYLVAWRCPCCARVGEASWNAHRLSLSPQAALQR